MAPGINFKKPPKRQPRLQANSKGLMTSLQQERTPKAGPELGSISGTGTNGLNSACFDNDASKASIYCTNCARVPRKYTWPGFPANFLGKSHWLRFSFGMIAETFGFSTQQNFFCKADDRHCCSHKIPVLSKAWRHCCRDMVSMTLATTFAHIKPPARCPRFFLSPSLLHKPFEPCKIVCVAWLKRRLSWCRCGILASSGRD